VSIIIEVLEAEPRAKLIMDQEAMDEMLLAELHDYMTPSLSASSRIPFSDGCKEQGTIDLLDILILDWRERLINAGCIMHGCGTIDTIINVQNRTSSLS
jgi:hypothetical protein